MIIYIYTSENPIPKRRQSEIALQILDYALKEEFDILKRPKIFKTEYGKPYFRGLDIHFSYSHCKYAVGCGVDTAPLGVDIQEIKKVRPAVVERVCCDNELKELHEGADVSGRPLDEAFIRMWTLKEAYAKFTGKGFAEGFNSIDTTTFPDGMAYRYRDCYVACYHEHNSDTVRLKDFVVLE